MTPATTTQCAVTQLATMMGAADVQFYVETGTTYITIDCDYDSLRDVTTPLSSISNGHSIFAAGLRRDLFVGGL